MTNSRASKQITFSAEQSTSPVADDAEGQFANTSFFGGEAITLGTAGELIQITALEYKTGTTVAGTVTLSAYIVNADPPSLSTLKLVASSIVGVNSGTSTTYKLSAFYNPFFEGGQLILAGINLTSASSKTRMSTGTDENRNFVMTYSTNPPHDQVITWANTANLVWMKIYYKVIT